MTYLWSELQQAPQPKPTPWSNITNTINAISTKIANAHETPMKVFYEVWTPPLMTAGSTTWINDVITKAGGVNIFANETDQLPNSCLRNRGFT